jgi:hypothetical protein
MHVYWVTWPTHACSFSHELMFLYVWFCQPYWFVVTWSALIHMDMIYPHECGHVDTYGHDLPRHVYWVTWPTHTCSFSHQLKFLYIWFWPTLLVCCDIIYPYMFNRWHNLPIHVHFHINFCFGRGFWQYWRGSWQYLRGSCSLIMFERTGGNLVHCPCGFAFTWAGGVCACSDKLPPSSHTLGSNCQWNGQRQTLHAHVVIVRQISLCWVCNSSWVLGHSLSLLVKWAVPIPSALRERCMLMRGVIRCAGFWRQTLMLRWKVYVGRMGSAKFLCSDLKWWG